MSAPGDIPSPTPSFRSVVHVNEKGGCFGGTEEYLDLLTAALIERGVASHLVCGALTGALPADLGSVAVIDGLASRELRPGTAEAVVAAVAAVDADVVYVHNVFDPDVVNALAASSSREVVLWYVHDHYLTCLTELRWRHDVGPCPHQLGPGCLRALEEGRCVPRWPDHVLDAAELERRQALAASLSRADAVIVVSEYMEHLLTNAAPSATVHRLDRPIRGRPDAPGRRGREDHAVVLFAGRINAEKGLAVLLEALAGLPPGAPVELRIAGVVEDAAYWSRCLELVDAATQRNARLSVTPLGHLTYPAIDAELGRADIVAIPSQWPEPLGAIALEAMAAGAAVVASRIGGLAGTVVDGETGMLVDPGDPLAWCATVADLLADPERCRVLGARAREAAAASSVDAHVDALDRLVAPLLRR